MWRELFYCVAGLALFFASDAFLDQALLHAEDSEETGASIQATDTEQGSHVTLSPREKKKRTPSSQYIQEMHLGCVVEPPSNN